MKKLWCYNSSRHKDPLKDRPYKEWTQRVHRDFRKKRSERDKVAGKAGWGGYGFASRPTRDGQGFVEVLGPDFEPMHVKNKRSVCGCRKAACRLISTAELTRIGIQSDPLVMAERESARIKPKRFRARKGQTPGGQR